MTNTHANTMLYLAFGAIALGLAGYAWWLFGRSDADRLDVVARNVASRFRVQSVRPGDGALWVSEHVATRFGEIGRVTRVGPSGELAQHVFDTRVELVAASERLALVRLRGELYAVRGSSSELVRLTPPGLAFAGLDARGDFVLQREDRTFVTVSRRTLSTIEESTDEPPLSLPGEACAREATIRAGDRTLRLVQEGGGRCWLEDERGVRLAGPFFDAYFIALADTLASPLGPRAVLVSHSPPSGGRALVRVEVRPEAGVLVESGERWLEASGLRPAEVRGCAPGGLLLVETQASGLAVVYAPSNRPPSTRLLSDARPTVHPL
jgi:hypothetical protein